MFSVLQHGTIAELWAAEFEAMSKEEVLIVSNAAHAAQYRRVFAGRSRVRVLDDGALANETRLGAVADLDFALRACARSPDVVVVVAGDTLFERSVDVKVTCVLLVPFFFFCLRFVCALFVFLCLCFVPLAPRLVFVHQVLAISHFLSQSMLETFLKSKDDAFTLGYEMSDPATQCKSRGVLQINEQNVVTRFVEKPNVPLENSLASAPFYIYRRTVLPHLASYLEEKRAANAPVTFVVVVFFFFFFCLGRLTQVSFPRLPRMMRLGSFLLIWSIRKIWLCVVKKSLEELTLEGEFS